jgi:hypothetical protein
MKTLTIERPEGLEKLGRRIHFDADHVEDFWSMDKRSLAHEVHEMRASMIQESEERNDIDPADYVLASCALHGSQLVVQESLSRDLEVSGLMKDVSKVVWPAPAIQMVFEDPSLPSVFLSRSENGVYYTVGYPWKERHWWRCEFFEFAGWELFSNTRDNGFIQSYPFDEGCCNQAFEHKAFKSYYDQDDPHGDDDSDGCLPDGYIKMTEDTGSYVAALAMKVLAYASIPQHAPLALKTRNEKKVAGIHPRQQTDRPALLIRSLPRIIRDTPTEDSNPTGKTHRFFGRAGHLRFYESDRFKNMKGQWQWMPPIPPPEGIQVVYRVRKVRNIAPAPALTSP